MRLLYWSYGWVIRTRSVVRHASLDDSRLDHQKIAFTIYILLDCRGVLVVVIAAQNITR